MNTQRTDRDSVTEVLPGLHAMRSRHGKDSPIGHRCTNLAQMFDAYATCHDEDRRDQLEKNIRRQMADLVGLTGGMQ